MSKLLNTLLITREVDSIVQTFVTSVPLISYVAHGIHLSHAHFFFWQESTERGCNWHVCTRTQPFAFFLRTFEYHIIYIQRTFPFWFHLELHLLTLVSLFFWTGILNSDPYISISKVDAGILCEPCNGRGWLLCDFCKGQKTNVKAENSRIYRRCPSCRAVSDPCEQPPL